VVPEVYLIAEYAHIAVRAPGWGEEVELRRVDVDLTGEHYLRWSRWRRRHQARARGSHYHRRLINQRAVP
jgi:hypothetical protein